MTLVKLAPSKAFSLVEDFLNDLPKSFRDDFTGNGNAFIPVNIKETKEYDNAAAFLIKSNINPEDVVKVVKDLLTVHL